MHRGMPGWPGMPMLTGVVELVAHALQRGPMPNPTRSFMLGDPAGGAVMYGCVIDVKGVDELVVGLRAPARLAVLTAGGAAATRPRSVPIWYGRTIGQIHGSSPDRSVARPKSENADDAQPYRSRSRCPRRAIRLRAN
jgi:hypothetical protein